MKRPNRSKDLARQRALIRTLIEQSPLAAEASATTPQRPEGASNVEYLWDPRGAAHRPSREPTLPANIIPFPNLREQRGS